MNPSRLLPMTTEMSGSYVEASKRSLRLFRNICRWIPVVISKYALEGQTDVQMARSFIGQLFRENAHVKDPNVIDILAFRGEQELADARLQYKTRTHVMEYICPKGLTTETELRAAAAFGNNKYPGASQFLQNFYDGKYVPGNDV
eukprot:GILJ01002398.1.p1 GENE.GILJ01002398.1~~GILJ01002398.1.p1  ORF type:complete len:166 (+),score=7.45 GILJ01002398.1:66-500(+)